MKVEKLILGELYTNCYIVINDQECLIIDPADEFNIINNYIIENNLKVIGILITHYHFDHIKALEKCVEVFKCPVIDYKNKQIISNFNYEIIDTKGHHYTGITYYFKNIEAMFVGDFIFRGSIGRIDLEGADASEMKKSINKIIKYNDNIKIYPGHGPETTLGIEKRTNPYLIVENNL